MLTTVLSSAMIIGQMGTSIHVLAEGDASELVCGEEITEEEPVEIIEEDFVEVEEESVAECDDTGSVMEPDGQPFGTGYQPAPEDPKVPALNSALSYAEMRSELVEGDDDFPLVMTTTHRMAAESAYPVSYDGEWLQYMKDTFPATRSQGIYGTCWAYAAVFLGEASLIKQGLADNSIDLSELHLVYWSFMDGTPSKAAGGSGDRIVFSSDDVRNDMMYLAGNEALAVQTLMRQRGYAEESTAPYDMADEIENGGSLDAATERQDSAYLVNAYQLNIAEDPELVKGAIKFNGGVSAGIHADTDRIGYNSSTNAYWNSTSVRPDHNVVLVGWDDDYPKENFVAADGTSPEHNGAWLVRNSWSDTAEADYRSYFWLSYEDRSLARSAWAFEADRSFPYDNHYYYDSEYHFSSAYCYDSFANVYTVNGEAGAEKEILKAVDFAVTLGETSTEYTVEIYKDLAGDRPDTGVLASVVKGKVFFPGNYTVELSEPVTLERGSSFAVVIRFDRTDAAVPMEYIVSGEGAVQFVAHPEGKSFYQAGNTSWRKNSSGDFSIGALTVDSGNTVIPTPTEKPDVTPTPADPGSNSYHKEDAVAGVSAMDAEHTLRLTLDQKGNFSDAVILGADGEVDTSVDSYIANIFTGNSNADGTEEFYSLVFTNGRWDTSYDSGKMGAYTYQGESYFVAGGVVNQNANGLIYTGDAGWKFLAAGRVVTGNAGLVMYGDRWFWIDDTGSCDDSYAAIVKWNGADFLVHGGRLRTDYTGFTYDPQDRSRWYHITAGQVWGDGEITDISIEGGEITRKVVNGVVE